MKECVKDIVAFGLNQKELDLVMVLFFVALVIVIGRFLLRYLNPPTEAEVLEKFLRENPLLAVDIEAAKRRGKWD